MATPELPTLSALGSMSVAELRTAIEQITTLAGDLHLADDGTPADLSAADSKRLDALLTLRNRATAHLQIREQFEKHPDSGEVAFRGPQYRTGDHRTNDPTDPLRQGGDALRSAALRLLEARGGDLPAAAQDRVEATLRSRLSPENPNVDGEYVARRMLITESPEYRSAFQQMVTDPHPLLTEPEIRAIRAYRELESRAMSENTTTAGGFGIPVFIDPSILLSSGAAAAPLLNAARVVPVTANLWKGVSSAPVTFTFQTEGAVASDASPTLAQPSITVHMARGWVPYSIELGQDYPAFANEMANLLNQGWIDSVATKTITGSGSGEPYGLFTRLDATSASEVRVTTAGTVDAQQIFRVWNALPERFRANATWVMSVSMESQIRSFGATANPSPYFTVDLTADGVSKINGRPVIVTDYAPTFVSGASSTANHLAVGDLSQYTIAMRQGLTVEPIQMMFQQVTAGSGVAAPTGTRGFFAWGRWGADVTVTNGARLLNQT